MRNFIIALLLVSIIITPCYAVNVIDTMLCKKVVLRAIGRTILVNRITGEVKYVLQQDGEWVVLKGSLKHQCQAVYNVQSKAGK
ncbi:MAG: hypothetical protein PHQ57_04480 [Candidatus Omnitrophica bacterium]|nr:hypothetical protein [Candidatus Omnitrophota bacterium]